MSDGGSISRSCSKVVLRRLQTFVHAQPDAPQHAGTCLQDVRFSEQEVRAAIMRKKNGKCPGFDDIPVEILKA